MEVTFQKELKWNRAGRGPRILVVFRFGKSEVEELGIRTISFPKSDDLACCMWVRNCHWASRYRDKFGRQVPSDYFQHRTPP